MSCQQVEYQGQENAEALTIAFETFSKASDQLQTSYALLEQRISNLNSELEFTSSQREKELLEKEQLANSLQHLLEILPAGVILLDKNGIVVEANTAAKFFLGDDIAGISWLNIIERSFAPQSDDGYEVSLKSGRRLKIATQALEPEPGQIVLLTDLTETRALQDRIKHQEKLCEMGKMVASLAHQIRTPMTTALLYAEQLQDKHVEQDTAKTYANRIVTQLNKLEQQISNMLLFAKSGEQVVEEILISDLLADIKEDVQIPLDEQGVNFTINDNAQDAKILCNIISLNGALKNLISNAVQSCQHNAEINLASTIDDNSVVLSVIDNGPGISESLQAKILDAFFTTKSGGTGLGLAVVKAVVDAHDGELSVSSEEGVGSVFTIRLPILNK